MKFEETVVKEGLICPKCRKKTLVRTIARELNQSKKGRWFLERCNNPECDYWSGGFT